MSEATFGEALGVGTGGEGTFGEQVAGWGLAEGPTNIGDETIPRDIDLGHGHSMTFNTDTMRALLHHPAVVAAITQRAQNICDEANSLAEHIGRPGREAPRYDALIQNRSDSTRARARVYPANYQALLDTAKNSTLLKATMAYPSDPIPTSQAAPPDTPVEPGWGPSAEVETDGAELGGAELGGDAAGLAEGGAGAAAL
ncbi:hypothetical protein [Mycobacterium sp. E787]|uniref:hypothetical protein n=1 Tax=Mycobacterium sp. E787 TaxID=1834150 RepID=UPI0007FE1EE8|nr:hypothetical protein [Mycobacterium sp. E787]OBI53590.1 hypothetical protein A5705_02955 [Mycobacterium sp. E787]